MFFLGGKSCPVLFGHLNLKKPKKTFKNLKNLKTFSKKPRFFPALAQIRDKLGDLFNL